MSESSINVASSTVSARDEANESKAMADALRAVRETNCSIRSASKKFGVAHSSLYRRVHNQHMKKPGGQAKFSNAEEAAMEQQLLSLRALGIPPDRELLLRIATRFAEENGRGYSPGDSWVKKFLQRHKVLATAIQEAWDKRKGRVWAEDKRTEWVQELISRKQEGFLDDPNGIWRIWECCLRVDGPDCTVASPRKRKKDDDEDEEEEGDKISVVFCGSAAGNIVKPLVICPQEDSGQGVLTGEPNTPCCMRFTDNGEVEDNVFAEYAQKEIIPGMTSEKNLVLVSADSLHTHNLDFLLTCLQNDRNIRLLFVPHSYPHQLPVLDPMLINTIMTRWTEARRNYRNVTGVVRRSLFIRCFLDLMPALHLGYHLTAKFSSAGIFPFLPESIVQGIKVPAGRKPPPPLDHSVNLNAIRTQLQAMGFSNEDVEAHIAIISASVKGKLEKCDVAESLKVLLKQSRKKKLSVPPVGTSGCCCCCQVHGHKKNGSNSVPSA